MRNRKIYILAYAHDLVLLAENKDGMKEMMEKWRYLYKKSFVLNVKKWKIIRCRNEGGKWKKV